MTQLEIEFFWPLTEQIPLDLDFSECPPHQYYLKAQGQPLLGPYNTGMIFATPEQNWSTTLTIEADKIEFTKVAMPWYRKVLFKLMGFKWKQ
jgi:hypothetical protein